MNNFSNLPKSWQVKTLGEVCEILDNMQKHINATEREQRLKNANRKYAYYGATGQVGYIDEFLCDFESILLGEDGAPFLEPFKNKAYIVSGKYWVNNHAHILKAKENLATNKFVCHFLNIVDYMPYVSGTTRLKLNQSAMKQIKIPLPPLDIQKRIVARLDEVFARIDNGTKHLKSAKANLAKYKQSLLKSAFNGTLTDTLPHPKPLPQGEGLTFDSPSLADSAFSCPPPPSPVDDNFTHSPSLAECRPTISPSLAEDNFTHSPSLAKSHLSCPPSLAEGARGWVDSHNNTTHCHTEALQKAEVSQKSTNRDSSLTAFAQNDNKGNHRDISLSTKAQYDNNGETPNLPQGWTIKTLGEIGEIVSGGTPSTTQADNFGGNIAWITPADLSNHNDKFISQGKRNISKKGLKSSSARLVPKGTILFSSRAPIGYVAIASNSLCTNQGFKSLIPKENVFSEFVYYYLLNAKSLAESYASGTTFKEISAKSFSKLPIPLPPLQTQKQIVEILEKHFSSADKTGAFIDSALKNAKQLKSSLLKSAFTGELA